MSELVVQIRAGHGWKTVGTMRPGDPPGSLSHNTPQGREVIVFACHDDHSTIERSVAGADVEVGEARPITTLGFEPLATLRAGETLEQWLRTDRMDRAALVCFRQVGP